MQPHVTRAALAAGLSEILASPSDAGPVSAIVVRPAHGERRELERCEMSRALGMHGDHWSRGCWKSTPEGLPDPDVQICLMNARCLALIAGGRDRWALAGDNLIVDLDLSPDNLAPGQRLRLGSAEIEITAVPHLGCAAFIERYGRDACVFVNTGEGRRLRLRGVYARVRRDGLVSVGDRVRKIG